jgi:hypothetical protein
MDAELINEVCVATSLTPLLVLCQSPIHNTGTFDSICRRLKSNGADFAVRDRLGRSVADVLLWHNGDALNQPEEGLVHLLQTEWGVPLFEGNDVIDADLNVKFYSCQQKNCSL